MSSLGMENGESAIISQSPPQKKTLSRRNTAKRLNLETPDQNLPARRSKRLKSGEALDVEFRSSEPKQEEEDSKVTLVSKSDIKEASVKCVQEQTDQELDEKPKRKTANKRKTKQEKEADMAPLAARATGLRMFVGAHVSAAKGECPRSLCIDLI